MIVSIVQVIVISFILILIVHNLYTFFQNTLTIPKTKDLVNKPSKQYADILNTIKSCNTTKNNNEKKDKNNNDKKDTTSIDMLNDIQNNNKPDTNLNPEQMSNMKTELRDFLTSLNTVDNTSRDTTPFSLLCANV